MIWKILLWWVPSDKLIHVLSERFNMYVIVTGDSKEKPVRGGKHDGDTAFDANGTVAYNVSIGKCQIICQVICDEIRRSHEQNRLNEVPNFVEEIIE